MIDQIQRPVHVMNSGRRWLGDKEHQSRSGDRSNRRAANSWRPVDQNQVFPILAYKFLGLLTYVRDKFPRVFATGKKLGVNHHAATDLGDSAGTANNRF